MTDKIIAIVAAGVLTVLAIGLARAHTDTPLGGMMGMDGQSGGALAVLDAAAHVRMHEAMHGELSAEEEASMIQFMETQPSLADRNAMAQHHRGMGDIQGAGPMASCHGGG
ncbi:MAG: hypothetical protein HY369_04025 [Candidatus Aenigmarchaeota archaeon]|nr:hypothetical protein [Candidatus Aenigmarchaeota archaeon]